MAAALMAWGCRRPGPTADWAEGRTTGRQLLVEAGLAMVLSLGGARLVKPMLAGVRGLVPKLQGWLRNHVTTLHQGSGPASAQRTGQAGG
jgi:hypothetical protein